MNYSGKKVVIVGGSGFVGTCLARELLALGARVIIVDPKQSSLAGVEYLQSDLSYVPSFEALQRPFVVFNLAGVPIFGRWTSEYKKAIRSSRVDITSKLSVKFSDPMFAPECFVSTSAIGIFGDRGDEVLDEGSQTRQDTYLAQVSSDWEDAARKAEAFGVRVRIVRNAHVLGRGGILSVLRGIFRWGIGGTLSSGDQYMSFVSIDECVRTYLEAPFSDRQVVHAVSVAPVTNREFSRTLARVMYRPCLFRIPMFAMRMLYGEFASEIVTSQRVVSLYRSGDERLEEVLRASLR
jgi:uncharacterized protein (TIGR01777 family)